MSRIAISLLATAELVMNYPPDGATVRADTLSFFCIYDECLCT